MIPRIYRDTIPHHFFQSIGHSIQIDADDPIPIIRHKITHIFSLLANRADLHDILQRKIGIGKSDLHTGRLILSQLFLKRKGFPAAPPHGSTIRLIIHRYHLRHMQVEKSACNTPNLTTLEPLFSLLFLCDLILKVFFCLHNDMAGNILFPCEKVRVFDKNPHFLCG